MHNDRDMKNINQKEPVKCAMKLQHKITVAIGLALQVYKTDWRGMFIDDVNNIFAKMECALDIDESRRVAFGILSSFPKDRIDESEDYDIIEYINFLTWLAMPSYLSRSRRINIFSIHHLPLIEYFDGQLPHAPRESSEYLDPYDPDESSTYLKPFKCTISNEVYDDLTAQYDKYLLAYKSFDYAAGKLTYVAGLAPDGVKFHRSEIFSLIAFLKRSLAVADSKYRHWQINDLSDIRDIFKDMLRRKNGNHICYTIAQQYIREKLESYHTPDVWHKIPPVLPDVRI